MTSLGECLNSRYLIRELLASGAMGDVYVAEDLRLERQVAVKVLSTKRAGDPTAVERFRREAQAAATLSHPNVVAVYDWGTADDTPFLVMQCVGGRDLRRLLRSRGTLLEAEALKLAGDIAAALQIAHQHGIVHRDVKPRNVLVDPNGPALLADFGIAASSDCAADESAVYGTATYLSPEQAQGLAVDGRSDLYSLGAVLYELLTGQPPFRGDTPEAVAAQHVRAPVVPPRAFRADLQQATEHIVLKALEKDPARRWRDAGEMRAAVDAAARRLSSEVPLADAPTARVARPQPEAGRAMRMPRLQLNWARPARWWAIAGAPPILLLALIAVPTLVGARHAAVPELAGRSVADAKAAVAAAGLALELEEQPTPDTPVGVIVTQDLLPNGRAGSGTTIHAIVSSGISVPDLTDRQCAEARAVLATAGWTVKPVRWRVANIRDFGKVVAQDPQPGAVVPQKGQISVQVAGPVRPC